MPDLGTDLPASAFSAIAHTLFAADSGPRSFTLPPKGQTQDDPFDVYIHNAITARVPPGITCVRAKGSLIAPDMVLLSRRAATVHRADLEQDPTAAMGLEVKKLERSRSGVVARASGMDFNSTPPSGKIIVYDQSDRPVTIPCFYLFACLESTAPGRHLTSGLVLMDGEALNADFQLYCHAVGIRSKRINLGTYGDGADRQRPMFVFSNPLTARDLDHAPTLIHRDPHLAATHHDLVPIGTLSRTIASGPSRTFYLYRPDSWPPPTKPLALQDPFRRPKRTEATQPRGRFTLDLERSEP